MCKLHVIMHLKFKMQCVKMEQISRIPKKDSNDILSLSNTSLMTISTALALSTLGITSMVHMPITAS